VGCEDECDQPNLRRCAGVMTSQECGNYDGDACLEWSAPVSCPPCTLCNVAAPCPPFYGALDGGCPDAFSFDDGSSPDQALCGPGSCPLGCCQSGQCFPGSADTACGQGGNPCAVCTPGVKCIDRTCKDPAQPDASLPDTHFAGCGPSNCFTGCCRSGACLPGDTMNDCGSAGDPCVACTSGQQCNAQACVQ
jgi:hypothetical protein